MGFLPKDTTPLETPFEPEAPYYSANAGNATDQFGRSVGIGDMVHVVAGIYINRRATVLDVVGTSLGVFWAAIHIPKFGIRVVNAKEISRC
jgi:hypothetical protein